MTSTTPTVLAVYPGGASTGPSMLPGWTRAPSAGAGYFGRVRGGETSGDRADELFVIERNGTVLRPMILLGTPGAAVTLTPSAAVLSTAGTRSLAPYSASPGDVDGDGIGDFAGSATFVQAYGFPGMAVYQSGSGGWMTGAVRFAPVAMGTLGSTAVSSAVID